MMWPMNRSTKAANWAGSVGIEMERVVRARLGWSPLAIGGESSGGGARPITKAALACTIAACALSAGSKRLVEDLEGRTCHRGHGPSRDGSRGSRHHRRTSRAAPPRRRWRASGGRPGAGRPLARRTPPCGAPRGESVSGSDIPNCAPDSRCDGTPDEASHQRPRAAHRCPTIRSMMIAWRRTAARRCFSPASRPRSRQPALACSATASPGDARTRSWCLRLHGPREPRWRQPSGLEFRESLELHTNSSNNTIYADADGTTSYFHANFIPKRDAKYDWRKPVDGSDPVTEWNGVLSIDGSPLVVNPANGWLYSMASRARCVVTRRRS